MTMVLWQDLKMTRGLVLIALLFSLISQMDALTLEEKIRDDPELSQFYSLLERNQIANTALNFRALTLFAPTNKAFQRYFGNKTYVLYHMLTVANTLEQLKPSVTSDMEGNPPLYITRRRHQNIDQIFVNNALIIKSRSNVQLINKEGKKQILHVIDDVLTPLTTIPSSTVDVHNPDAFQFLTFSESLDIGHHRVRSYRQKVIMHKKEYLYQTPGAHTFLIPVEEGFKSPHRPDMIDRKVIDGHIIPNRTVFTAAAPLGEPLPTAAFEDNLKVLITFFSQADGKSVRTYVKSQTLIGDSVHAPGVVLSEIVRANIPVENGVVHLIQRPLVIVDTNVIQFLEEKEDGPLSKFFEVIQDFGSEFVQQIRRMKDVTLFAPSNEAWSDSNLNNIIRNRDRMREILNLHIVRDRLNTDKIKTNNLNQINQVPTLVDRRFLYFNIFTNRDRNQTITVEGGGVNATIIQADIAATNGFVHIIDKVLGVPYSTVLDKLRTDPMLKDTFRIGSQKNFNQQLAEKTKRFTYFVPRDRAWKNSEAVYPQALRKLFLSEFANQAADILGRHLIVGDRAFTMGELRQFVNQTVELPTVNGMLRIRVKEEDRRYSILYNNRWIQVYRPDVECTNGIIHVIDFPLLDDTDSIISGASPNYLTLASVVHLFCAILFTKLLM
ncbi:fasciclin-1-like [Phlebotomus papatasi]|uniref:fasciclin-1-like n=1 Tax=Phlebotomus papatasi TaxID=29031 RepID=UPI0024847337|nr:fasciclin-1-like [Phlebotomus papatasi]